MFLLSYRLINMCDLRYGFILLLDLRYLNTERRCNTKPKSAIDESYLPGSIENLSFCLTRVGSQTCSECSKRFVQASFDGIKKTIILSTSFLSALSSIFKNIFTTPPLQKNLTFNLILSLPPTWRGFFSIRVFTTVFIAYHKMVISDRFTQHKNPSCNFYKYLSWCNTIRWNVCVHPFFGSALFSNIIELVALADTFEFSCLRQYDNVSPMAPFKIFSVVVETMWTPQARTLLIVAVGCHFDFTPHVTHSIKRTLL